MFRFTKAVKSRCHAFKKFSGTPKVKINDSE